MKIRHIVFMFLLLCLASPANSADKTTRKVPKLEGFGALKFGISLSEARQIVPLRCFKEDEKGQNECSAKTEKVSNGQGYFTDVGGVRVKVGYVFKNQKLITVYLMSKDYNSRDLMIKNITEKYGKPSKSAVPKPNSSTKITEWQVYEAKITLEDLGKDTGGVFFVNLIAPPSESLGF